MRYLEEELVAIAKREKNVKRNYLVVNRLQGKHIPVKPEKALEMFDSLAEVVLQKMQKKKILVIGFAETATAIGSEVAIKTKSFFMQTTREEIEGVEYFYFSEVHSHAAEQKLVKTDLDRIIYEIEEIVFVEDEITTGNTILNIVREIKRGYSERKISFSVASILNGMDEMAIKSFKEEKISYFYLVKTDHRLYGKRAEQFKKTQESFCFSAQEKKPIQKVEFLSECNPRRLTDSLCFFDDCVKAAEQVLPFLKKEENILVLGTEEFMFPGLWIAREIEKLGYEVYFHATTRSPIVPSKEEEYPLHHRFQMRSCYQEDRITFLYDVRKYDKVFIVTDADCTENIGLMDLEETLEKCGNHKIVVLEWKKK